jgi:hypothetical protein
MTSFKAKLATAAMAIAAPLSTSADAATVNAIEFVGTHVFLTADPSEIAALDSGAIPGWKRSGSRFLVSREPEAGLVPVCRFYRAGAEPANAHFYTAFPEECEALKRSGDWVYEGIAFHVWPVESCGRVTGGGLGMWRAYNQGRDGIDTHRLTKSLGVVDMLRETGWVAEGPAGLAWCIERGQGAEDALVPGKTDLSLFDGSTWELSVHDYHDRDRKLLVSLGVSGVDPYGSSRTWDTRTASVTTDLAVADRGLVAWSPVDGTIGVLLLDRASYSPGDLGGVLAIGMRLVLLSRDRVEGIAQEEPIHSCILPGCVVDDPKRFRVTGRRR